MTLKLNYKISKKEIRKRQSINSKYQKELIDRATPAEIEVQKILKMAGIKFLFQKDFIWYIVDFYLPKPKKICVEIDGGYFTNEQVFNNPISIPLWGNTLSINRYVKVFNELRHQVGNKNGGMRISKYLMTATLPHGIIENLRFISLFTDALESACDRLQIKTHIRH